MTHAEYARLGGFEGAEVIMWLVMRGALSDKVKRVHSSYYLPSMTGIATLVLENEAAELPDAEAVNDRHRARMAEQLAGVEELTGTYPFDILRSVKGYRINKFLHDLVDAEHRARFLDEPETAFKDAGLIDEEQDFIRNRDWPGMIHYGVSFFMLEKLAAVIGASNLHIYAAMRGETLEEFLETRNTQVTYSVAGKKEQ
jgi:gallate dioxygenase